MGNLIRMDLYRMFKAKASAICLLIAFVLALGSAPFEKLMYSLGNMLSEGINETFPAQASLSAILSNPFPLINTMLALLSLCFFFHGDVEKRNREPAAVHADPQFGIVAFETGYSKAPCLIGLTPPHFAHWAAASCAPPAPLFHRGCGPEPRGLQDRCFHPSWQLVCQRSGAPRT